VTQQDLAHADAPLEQQGVEVRAVVEPSATLSAALESLLVSRVGVVAVVDGTGAVLGAVDTPVIMTAVESMHSAVPEETSAVGRTDAAAEGVATR